MEEIVKKTFESFGKKIRKLRKERNLSVKELSKLTGIREQYLYKIESGKAYGMCTSYVLLFAKSLNVEIKSLFD